MLPLRYEADRGEGDPFVRFAITDAGIDLLVFGMVSHHFDVLHPLLGTLSEALDPMGLDSYILFDRGEGLTVPPDQVAKIREVLCLPATWMAEHVTERLDYIRREDGMVQLDVPVPDFYWLVVALELMTPMFDPASMQYDFVTRLVDKGETLFTDAELMAGWSPETGGAMQ
jgi:hypothetical protein